MQLGALTRFPVKSCRGEDVPAALVERWGLAGDRRWMIVDPDGAQITARELPRMLLVSPRTRPDGGLVVTAPGAGELAVDVPQVGELTRVQVWSSALDALPAAKAAHTWFSTVLGRPARLVHLDDPTRRPVSPDHSRPGDVVSFADGYPLNVATTASLDALNDLIGMGRRADEGPIPMSRFRANLVVEGARAWEEDGWRRLRVGEAVFRVVKGCDRCAIPTTDTESAQRFKEPTYSLAQHRRWDGAVWFAMNAIPDTPGAVVRVGDEVEVLEADPAPDGPPR